MEGRSDEAERTRVLRALPTGEPNGALVTFSGADLGLEYSFALLERLSTGSLLAHPYVGTIEFEGVYAVRFRDDHCDDGATRFPGIGEAKLVEVLDSRWLREISAQVSRREQALLAGAHHLAVRFVEFGLLEVISDRVRFDGVRPGGPAGPPAVHLGDHQRTGTTQPGGDYLL